MRCLHILQWLMDQYRTNHTIIFIPDRSSSCHSRCTDQRREVLADRRTAGQDLLQHVIYRLWQFPNLCLCSLPIGIDCPVCGRNQPYLPLGQLIQLSQDSGSGQITNRI